MSPATASPATKAALGLSPTTVFAAGRVIRALPPILTSAQLYCTIGLRNERDVDLYPALVIGTSPRIVRNTRSMRSRQRYARRPGEPRSAMYATPLQPKTVDSSGAAEVLQASRAAKDVVGMRILYKELGATQATPLPLRTDAKVLVDGARCQRVSQESKRVAARYIMVREAFGAFDGLFLCLNEKPKRTAH